MGFALLFYVKVTLLMRLWFFFANTVCVTQIHRRHRSRRSQILAPLTVARANAEP